MTDKNKIIFHIDVNSAFLSWTAVNLLKNGYDFDIRNIPSAISGDPETRRGIILAKSVPAKKYNITTGETIQEALKKCPSLKIYKPDFDIYHIYSKQMGEILTNYSPNIQQFSIDEYFIEYVPLLGPYLEVAERIRKEIYTKLGFTVNIGISTNKVLAKMASDFTKPDKIHTLLLDELEEKLWPLPIERLFLCGKQSSKKLRKMGINTIGKMANSDLNIITYHLKSQGKVLHNYANGIDDSIIEQKDKNKCYSNSLTTSKDIDNLEDAYKLLLTISENVSRRIRKDSFKATTITIQVKLNTFQSFTHGKTIQIPTCSTTDIYNICCDLLNKYWDLTPLRLLGITLSNLVSDATLQLNLFDADCIKKNNIDNSVDKIFEKFGADINICRASIINTKKDFK